LPVLTTDIGKEFNFIKDQKFLQNLVLTVLHGSLERKEQVLKPKEVKAPRETHKKLDY
jgi:hypothetical protein